jgi:hypothetical protein
MGSCWMCTVVRNMKVVSLWPVHVVSLLIFWRAWGTSLQHATLYECVLFNGSPYALRVHLHFVSRHALSCEAKDEQF